MLRPYIMVFNKNIDIIEGSRFTHTIGRAICGTILSELNFQSKVEDQAYKNYTYLKRRMQSRFLNKCPGRMWLDSSKTDESGFLEGHLKNNRNKEDVIVYDNPIWAAKPHEYSGATFPIYAGDSLRDPFVIRHKRQIIGLDEAKIIHVPVEHEQDFIDVVENGDAILIWEK